VAGGLESVNRSHWEDADVVGEMRGLQGWSDPGEPLALARVATAVRGRPALDIGVGTGRTTTFVTLLTDDYIGVDYTPAMLDVARQLHPTRDLREGDARDLSSWPDGRFAFVMFSFNGIDAVDHEGRGAVLREMARVVAADGFVIYSTHNKLGPAYRETPWHRARRHVGPRPLWVRVAKAVALAPQRFGELRRTYTGWWRSHRAGEDNGDWAIAPLAVHDYRFLVHFTTLGQAIDEAASVGLEVDAVFGNNGRRCGRADDTSDVDYFHLVLRPASR
jgi:SAM-dependent methyltransferase